MERSALLTRRAGWLFGIWAPAVLAAQGDWRQEQAALARPGVAAARAEYELVLAELQDGEARSGCRALNDVFVASACIEAALARGPTL